MYLVQEFVSSLLTLASRKTICKQKVANVRASSVSRWGQNMASVRWAILCTFFKIRYRFISNLVQESLKFKKFLELQGKS